MTQDVSEGVAVRSLPPPPVPPRPTKQAVAEAMARSRLTFAAPLARQIAPEKSPEALARLYPSHRDNSHDVGKRTESESCPTKTPSSPTTTERISAKFCGVRLNQREAIVADGERQVIFQSAPTSSTCVGRGEPLLLRCPPVEVGGASSRRPEAADQGRPVRRPTEEGASLPPGREPAAGEAISLVEERAGGKTISVTLGESVKSDYLRVDRCRADGSSGNVVVGEVSPSASGDRRVGRAEPAEFDRSCAVEWPSGGEGSKESNGTDPPIPDVCYRKVPGGEVSRMASLRGLPPLPKSLSGVMDLEGIRLMEAEMGARSRRSLAVTEEHSRQGHPSGSPSPSSPSPQQQQDVRLSTSSHRHHQIQPLSAHPVPPPPHYLSQHHNGQDQQPPGRGRKQTSLDMQLALLRQEMVGLRQLDLSLLSQLWSLNESIQEFRVLLQEEQEDMSSALSPPSPSPSLSSGDEDDDDDGNGDYYQTPRQQQLHYRQKRQRQQQSAPGEGPSGLKSTGSKTASGSKKLNLYNIPSHNDSVLAKRYTPSSPSTPSSSTRSSFEFGEV